MYKFIGAFLYKISTEKVDLDDKEKLYDICKFSNKVAALTTTKYGAISALPSISEVENFN